MIFYFDIIQKLLDHGEILVKYHHGEILSLMTQYVTDFYQTTASHLLNDFIHLMLEESF